MTNKNILLIVEGENIEPRLMKKVFSLYFHDEFSYNIFSFKTNIHVFYNVLKRYSISGKIDFDNIDIIKILESISGSQEQLLTLSKKFTDIVLIFDFDPQDRLFNKKSLLELVENFNESTDIGKLYINYPMVESYKHIHCLPDPLFLTRYVEFSVLKNGEYKKLAAKETFQNDIRKLTKKDLDQIIIHNIEKMRYLIYGIKSQFLIDPNDFYQLLNLQISEFQTNKKIFILNTCLMFIYEYNSEIIRIV